MIEVMHKETGLCQRHHLQRDTLALIMAGGNGSRLGGLTDQQCKPALSFAGGYRNIDFTLSNCINSGLRRIAVLTQYNAHTLLHHITQNWNFLCSQTGEFIELWPAQKRTDDNWYLGTANAIAQNMDLISEHAPKYTVILAGDHIYKMDYSELLCFHQQRDADLTVGSIEVPIADASQFGVMGVDGQQRILTFDEKPMSPRPVPGCRDTALASMGIYVFNTEFLLQALCIDARNDSSSHDFGKDILPWAIGQVCAQVFAYPFRDRETGEPGYWRDVGTIDAYWQAQMDLLEPTSALDLCDRNWPILGCTNSTTPARFSTSVTQVPGLAIDSLVSGACILEGGRVDHSLLSPNVYVGAGSIVENSVLLEGAYIGINCQLNKVIVDSDCIVPDGTVIGINHVLDRQRFDVSVNGIVLLTDKVFSQLVTSHQLHVA